MKLKPYLLPALLALSATFAMEAQQPYGGCWHPDDIKDWSPETDPDAKFNRARVPLADRFREPQTMRANENQFYEGQVCNATILFPTCSLCPSQGADNFLGYQPTYWQYMDKLVYWAGSASEGIIIPPPAGSTDAAHQAGVKSIGQIFFPPHAYGGETAWVHQMLTKEDGKYIYAIKLYEIAKYMGFDGWFINEETGGGSDQEWCDFIKEFNAIADANGDTQMEIQWYNASGWPNTQILKTHKNTSQFLEYGSPGDYRYMAETLGCTEAETFSKIYGGIQCVNSGLTGYGSALQRAFQSSGHVGSVDLFCPEERAWKDNVKNYLGTDDECGEKAYAAIAKTFENEEKVWVNTTADPSQLASGTWKGFSGHMVERSAITSMPFVSDMCVGVGKHRFVEGEKKGTQDWYHSGVQSVLPTWRFWIENRGDLKVSIDWDDAYNLGSSFKFTGNLTGGDHLVRLYKTMIPVNGGGIVRVAYKTNGSAPELKLSTESSVNPDVTLAPKATSDKNGWTVAEYDLASANGKTIYMIGLNLKGSVSDYVFSLGQLAVLPAGYTPATLAVDNAKANRDLPEEGGDLRLTWDFDWSDDFDRFDIALTDGNGTRVVGSTRDEAFYIANIAHLPGDAKVDIAIVPVMKDGSRQDGAKLAVSYPKPTAPQITFKLSKSYLTVGETATMTMRGTGNPTSYKWTLPSTLELVEGALTDPTITVKALAAGRQMVKAEATNEIGTGSREAEVCDVYEAGELGNVTNVVLNKSIVGFSGSTNSTEVPDNIIDGVTNPWSTSAKWCNIAPENWVIFDCLGSFRIYGFKIYDANSGPESGCDQIHSYTIELSKDCENWTTVVNESGRSSESIKEDYVAPMSARYIRFSPKVKGTLRVWEFEAYGIDDTKMTIAPESRDIILNAGESKDIVIKYALNGDERAEDFSCAVTLGKANVVTLGDITENESKGEFVIPVTAAGKFGSTDMTVRVTNGPSYKECTIQLSVDCPNATNILAGTGATVYHYKDDMQQSYDEYTFNTLTDGNTSADALEEIENPSTHIKDVQVVFSTEATWNISKVKVYLPNANKGINDNDVEGLVNKSVTIGVGNSIRSLTTIKKVENVGELSEIECILSAPVKCKYIVITCDVNALFYPAMAEVEAFEQIKSEGEYEGPCEMTGWNADLIAEATPVNDFVNAVMDDQGWVFYSDGVQAEGAIAGADRSLTSTNDTEFQFAPYEENNALRLTSKEDTGTLTFVEPMYVEECQILATCANGSANMDATFNYEDGTNKTVTFSLEDWYGGSTDITAKTQIYRIFADPANWDYDLNQVDRRSFRLFECVAQLDLEKKLTSITFERYRNYPIVFAVSAKGIKASSGIEVLPAEKADREIAGYYNLQGMEVKNPTNGIYIVRYSDGTSAKLYIK